VKFNWKNRKFISGLLTVILLGIGVANPAMIGALVTEGVCVQVQCDAA
jgi:hypothetical protein